MFGTEFNATARFTCAFETTNKHEIYELVYSPDMLVFDELFDIAHKIYLSMNLIESVKAVESSSLLNSLQKASRATEMQIQLKSIQLPTSQSLFSSIDAFILPAKLQTLKLHLVNIFSSDHCLRQLIPSALPQNLMHLNLQIINTQYQVLSLDALQHLNQLQSLELYLSNCNIKEMSSLRSVFQNLISFTMTINDSEKQMIVKNTPVQLCHLELADNLSNAAKLQELTIDCSRAFRDKYSTSTFLYRLMQAMCRMPRALQHLSLSETKYRFPKMKASEEIIHSNFFVNTMCESVEYLKSFSLDVYIDQNQLLGTQKLIWLVKLCSSMNSSDFLTEIDLRISSAFACRQLMMKNIINGVATPMLRKLTLDLSCNSYEGFMQIEGKENHDQNNYECLIMNLHRRCRETLQRLSLNLDGQNVFVQPGRKKRIMSELIIDFPYLQSLVLLGPKQRIIQWYDFVLRFEKMINYRLYMVSQLAALRTRFTRNQTRLEILSEIALQHIEVQFNEFTQRHTFSESHNPFAIDFQQAKELYLWDYQYGRLLTNGEWLKD